MSEESSVLGTRGAEAIGKPNARYKTMCISTISKKDRA
jgi:hypothetical protein